MGCDIHIFAEKKVRPSMKIFSSGGEKKLSKYYWTQIKGSFKNSYYDPTQPMGEYNLPHLDEPYQGRNYTLFAFLANVRNNHDIKPLAEPRGIPKGVSSDIQKEIDDWDRDGHSHSYFTLEELDKVDWDKTVVKEAGLVDPENYKLFKKTGRPSEWCQGTTAKNYKEIEWFVSLSEFCRDFCYDTLGDLRNIARKENIKPKDIRLVFFFDN